MHSRPGARSLMAGILEALAAHGALRDLDLHFARFMGDCADRPGDELRLAAALVSRAAGDGHVCIALDELAGKALPVDGAVGKAPALMAPAGEAWRAALLGSGAVGDATDAEADCYPLVLDRAGRLYLARYWRYECDLAANLGARSQGFCDGVDDAQLAAGLDRLFPARDGEPDWQRTAAALAVLKRLLVISGGPGTGKTTTVTRLLALLLEQSSTPRLRIALAAPTGKAATRLTESIRAAKASLNCRAEITDAIPEEAATLHRLLGWRPRGYHHHAANPLPLDLLVVDEASMIDLPMMARLATALPAHARLILLGDKDQLASVEAGNVLGDLCGDGDAPAYSPALCARLRLLAAFTEATETRSAIADSVVLLTKSYRFGADSGIGRLARRVNAGDGRGAFAVLSPEPPADVAWQPLSQPALPDTLLDRLVNHYHEFLQARDVAAALRAFNRFRVLCAVKGGPLGVNALNQQIERVLARAGLIRPDRRWYHGRPIMVTANDYGLRLYNGDTGLVWTDADGQQGAFFATGEGSLRRTHTGRLSNVETCFATTVHKSQGSEFEEVLMVLPGADSPVMTRELIYTGLTRARHKVTLCGDRSVFEAVTRRVARRSGLREALWGVENPEHYRG